MKTTVKITTALTFLFACSMHANAQSTPQPPASPNGVIYSIGAEGGIVTNDFKDTHKVFYGGSIQADIPVASQLYATINAGYSEFIGKDNIDGTGIKAKDLHFLPVMAGLKFFPVPLLYIQADAGAGFALDKSNQGFEKTAVFIYTPQIGLQIPFNGKSYLDAGIRYEATTKFVSGQDNSKIDFIGLRLAYGFSL